MKACVSSDLIMNQQHPETSHFGLLVNMLTQTKDAVDIQTMLVNSAINILLTLQKALYLKCY